MLSWLLACTSPPLAPTRPPLALAGTRWLYEELDGAEPDAWEFDADGTLFVATGNNPVADTWMFDGSALTVKINDYATYEGHVTAQGGFVGAASNPAGKTWQWFAVRDLPPALDGCGDSGSFDVTDTRWRRFDDGSAQASGTVFFLGGSDTWSQAGDDVTWTVDGAAKVTGKLVGDHTIVARVPRPDGALGRVRLVRTAIPGECP